MHNQVSPLVVEDPCLFKTSEEVDKHENSSSSLNVVVEKVLLPKSQSEVFQEMEKFYDFEIMQVRSSNGVPSLASTQSTRISPSKFNNTKVSQKKTKSATSSQERSGFAKAIQGKSSNRELSPEISSGRNKSSILELNQVESSSEEIKSKVELKKEVRKVLWKNKLESGRCRGCEKSFKGRSEDSNLDLIEIFEHVHASGQPNFQCCRIPVCQASLNLAVWRERLKGYKDVVVCDYLEYGFPLDFNRQRTISCTAGRNHKGARDYPQFINKYFEKERKASRVAGPFPRNPLSVDLAVSPINTVPKDSADERRVIVDLSWPLGSSVNDGISKDVYLGEEINLHYASVEQVCTMVNEIGPGAVIYKRDLRHAYRQIAVDPRDYRYLGYYWEKMYYFDTVLAMGQRNAAMACARTTDAIVYMHQENGYKASTNYLDDLIGVSPPSTGVEAYDSLGQLLHELGLLENLTKACPPATIQIVLGILIDTVEGTMSVPVQRMEEIISLVSEWQQKVRSTKVELQSLIGKLQYITKCVLQSRVFLNRLLDTLRLMNGKKSIRLSASFQKDLKWWSMFVEKYNGVSFIPSSIWTEPDVTFATDSCLVGCGGLNSGEYFHSGFPEVIEKQQLPIHCLEMLTVLVAVRIWGCHLTSLRVQIYCDNEPAVKVINSGKTKDVFMGSCIRELWLEVAKYGFQLRAVHLPGEENRVPDWLSRWDCGQNYRDLFNEFISGEPDKYSEVMITPDLFEFSGEL